MSMPLRKRDKWHFLRLGARWDRSVVPIYEDRVACPPSREYRLYQSSFLIRDYGFKAENFAQIVDDEGFLPNVDPKLVFAKMNPDIFPIDLNTATYYEMI